MFPKIFKQILRHKIITGIIIILVVAGGYFAYQKLVNKNNVTKYVTAEVQKGTIIASVSGSGQVSALSQIDIKPKVSGELLAIYVKNDQEVKAGQLLASLDSTDAERAMRDNQTSLDNAKRDLDKAEQNYQDVKTNSEDSLTTAYEDGYTTVSTTFFKLSDYMSDLQDVLGTKKDSLEYITSYRLILGSDSTFVTRLLDDYNKASELFNTNFAFFRTVFQDSDRSTIYKLIGDTLETTKAVSQTLESARHLYDAIVVEDYTSINAASHINTMKPKIESDVSAVYSNIDSLQQIKDTIDNTNTNTPRDIDDALFAIQTAKDAVTKKEEALSDAKTQFAEYSVYAPFSGTITALNEDIKKGDSVSSGTVLATLFTKEKIAEISLNEIDVAKVKVGQKATITFDALPDVTISGEVLDIDETGTTSQGVVSYGVKIVFDTQDERIKPGMSMTADIITAVKQDVLIVANSAVKSSGGTNYVEIMPDNSQTPQRQTVETGLSNDTMTEIVSGLEEGDIVVTSTISQSTTQTTQTGGETRMFFGP